MSRGINPAQFNDRNRNPIADRFLQSIALSGGLKGDLGKAIGGVDIIRLSMNVKRNLIKEREESTDQDNQDSYHSNNNSKGSKNNKLGAEITDGLGKEAGAKETGEDIDLTDKNVVLNFGDQ